MKPYSANPNLTEPRRLRMLLIAAALGFLLLMLVVPLVAVFYEALKGGWDLYLKSLSDPEAWSAVKLTLITALIAVPVNAVLGVAMAWLLTRFDFLGKQLLTTLLDLPFSVSPVVAGLMFVLLFGAHTALGSRLEAQGIQIIFAIPGIVLTALFVTFPFAAREIIPLMQTQGDSEEQAALVLGASGGRCFGALPCPTSNGRCSTASSSPTPVRWASSARSAWYRDTYAAKPTLSRFWSKSSTTNTTSPAHSPSPAYWHF